MSDYLCQLSQHRFTCSIKSAQIHSYNWNTSRNNSLHFALTSEFSSHKFPKLSSKS